MPSPTPSSPPVPRPGARPAVARRGGRRPGTGPAAGRRRRARPGSVDGGTAPHRPPPDPLGAVDEEDHARDGADRVLPDREGPAARRVLPALRGPADEGDGGPGPADGFGAAPPPGGSRAAVEGRHR